MPPVCNQRAPSVPKISSQSIVARLQLRDGRVPAIRAAQRGAHAKAALGEVEAVAHGAADAVVLDPLHALFDAALEHQVFDEAADGVVGKRRDDRRVETEAALQSARDVVFAAAFPDLEACGSVWTRPSPGSSRSITSPRDTQSQRQDPGAQSRDMGEDISARIVPGAACRACPGCRVQCDAAVTHRWHLAPGHCTDTCTGTRHRFRFAAAPSSRTLGRLQPSRVAPRPGPCARSACEPRQGRKAAALSSP